MKSETIYWLLSLLIHPGHEARFKEISAQLIESTRAEAGTLNYEWTLSEDGGICHVYERYVDSAAIKLHLQRSAELVGQLLSVSTPQSFFIYGSPDEEVKKDLAGLKPVYMTPLGGFSH